MVGSTENSVRTPSGEIDAYFPPVFRFLFDDRYRYKVLYGGRGGGRSWAVARWLLIDGTQKRLFVLCCRELQKSISESVHRLLSEQIELLGLQAAYRIEKARIIGTNGTEFVFSGLKNDPSALRSFEGIDRVWVEEAANVSRASWNVLLPTVRRPGSQIILTFNPVLETDETLIRFVYNALPDSKVVKTTWRDNPCFPKILEKEMAHCQQTDPDLFSHIWEGCPISFFASSVYANELRQVDADHRITRVPYDHTRPVDCYWDLGFDDMTAVWFVQSGPFEYRLIDYLQTNAHTIDWYIREMQSRGYMYGTDWLPWDIGTHATQMGSGRSIEELMRLAGRKVRITPKLSVADGINAARTLFPLCWFDAERTADGVQALRHYRYGEVVKTGSPTREPLHDINCFHPLTLVLTRHGTRPIIDLQTNSEVLTPCGWKPCVQMGITGRNAQLVEVRFADGITVKCTPDHLFLTATGWKSAESLTPDTLIQSSLTRSRSISMAEFIAIGRVNAIFKPLKLMARVAGRLVDCIAMYGRALSGLFPTDVISITGIPIAQTIGFSTLNVFPNPITSVSPGRTLSSTLRSTSTSATKPDNWLRNGIGRKLDDCGTDATWKGSKPGRSRSEKKSRVSIAGSSLWRSFAKKVQVLRSTAPSLARPLRIESVSLIAERSDVCCIYVEDGHWFSLANGAVVHNSHGADAFRYFALCAKPPKPVARETGRPQRPPVVSTWS